MIKVTPQPKRMTTEAFLELYREKSANDALIEEQIRVMRGRADLFDIQRGYFFCRGLYGKAIATKKDVVLYDLASNKVIMEASFKRHLDAKHTALRWAVEGDFE